jgi:undecaprenyl diphosphate synthase
MSNINTQLSHLWIIMDWNRRWARSKLLPSVAWHKAWADNVIKITKLADKQWIKYLTLWALSENNLKKREKKEVEWIIKLINNIESFLWEMLEDNLRFDTIWNLSELPKNSQIILERVKEKTKNNTWITLVIALVYGWQDEIVRATKKILDAWINPEILTKKEFRKYLDTANFPMPELIVRTWWDIRHSGFMLFDSEYSEYYFTEKNWPEFNEKEFSKCMDYYWNTKRNFGK